MFTYKAKIDNGQLKCSDEDRPRLKEYLNNNIGKDIIMHICDKQDDENEGDAILANVIYKDGVYKQIYIVKSYEFKEV